MPRYDRDVVGNGEAGRILTVLRAGDPICEFGVIIIGSPLGWAELVASGGASSATILLRLAI